MFVIDWMNLLLCVGGGCSVSSLGRGWQSSQLFFVFASEKSNVCKFCWLRVLSGFCVLLNFTYRTACERGRRLLQYFSCSFLLFVQEVHVVRKRERVSPTGNGTCCSPYIQSQQSSRFLFLFLTLRSTSCVILHLLLPSSCCFLKQILWWDIKWYWIYPRSWNLRWPIQRG